MNRVLLGSTPIASRQVRPMPSPVPTPPKRRGPASVGRTGLELGPLLTLIAIFTALFVGVGAWFHADLEAARQAAQKAEATAANAQGDLKIQEDKLAQYRRDLEIWSAPAFAPTCEA